MLAAKKALLKGKNLDEVLLDEKLAIAKLLIKRGYSEGKTTAILSFLHNYVRFEKPETNRIFEHEIDRLTDKTNIMGIIEQVKQMRIAEAKEEGRKEGLKEARAKMATTVVRNLIAETSFSDRKIADIAGVSEAFVKRVRQRVK
ncbi:MAG TPA: hypothetical protein VIM64_04765, partial [Puia sp.]